mgnify:CR=1 FL=1|jgi:hypothetical protein
MRRAWAGSPSLAGAAYVPPALAEPVLRRRPLAERAAAAAAA